MQEEIARVKASLAARIAEYDDYEPASIATQPAPPHNHDIVWQAREKVKKFPYSLGAVVVEPLATIQQAIEKT